MKKETFSQVMKKALPYPYFFFLANNFARVEEYLTAFYFRDKVLPEMKDTLLEREKLYGSALRRRCNGLDGKSKLVITTNSKTFQLNLVL